MREVALVAALSCDVHRVQIDFPGHILLILDFMSQPIERGVEIVLVRMRLLILCLRSLDLFLISDHKTHWLELKYYRLGARQRGRRLSELLLK